MIGVCTVYRFIGYLLAAFGSLVCHIAIALSHKAGKTTKDNQLSLWLHHLPTPNNKWLARYVPYSKP